MTSLRQRRAAVLLLLLSSVVMTMLAWRGPLLGYDDVNLFAEVAGRSPLDFFTGLFYYAYLPFYGLSYWLDTMLAGGAVEPLLVHIGNALWHAAAGFAVYCVLARLLAERPGAEPGPGAAGSPAGGALLGAVLFVLHPLHVESAAWIAGRKELVSGFFFFLAWIFHLRAEEGKRGAVAGAVVCFLVACLAKAAAIVLPALVLAAAWMMPRYEGRRREAAWRTAYLWIAALVPLVLHLAVGFDKGVLREVADVGQRSMWGLKAWGDAVRRTILPFGLAVEYGDVRAATLPQALLSGAWLAAAGVGAFLLRRRQPGIAFGIVAFLVALAPFNNVFPATDVLAADRYLYLPLFGLAIAAGWAAARHARVAVAGALLALVYAGLSLSSSTRFRSDEELWSRTIEVQPEAAIAWLNRGIDRVTRAASAQPADPALRDAGIEDLREGLARARRDRIRARANLALVLPLLQAGQAGEALQRADRALELVPDTESADARRHRAEALYDRGLVRKALGGFAEAALDFTYAAKLVPDYQSHREAGMCFFHARDLPNARIWLRSAASRDRAAIEPWVILAQVEAMAGEREAERAALEEATARGRDDPAVVEAWVEYQLGGRSPDYRKAREELERLPRDHPARKRKLAGIEARRALYLFRRGDLPEAVEAADAARAAGLSQSDELYELGQVYLATGRFDTAARCFLGAADVLGDRRRWRDAAARAYALKAHARAAAGDSVEAARAFRAALETRPQVIEAGMAPLREGEITPLGETASDSILVLAAAAVAGDPALARRAADAIFAAEPEGAELDLALRIRALVRVFVTRDFEGAEDDLRELLVRKPKDRWARYRLAQARLRNGVGWIQTADSIGSVERRKQGEDLLRGAVERLGELLEDHPDFVYARLLRGEAWFSLGDQVGAKADYQRVREQAPDLKEVYLREAVLHRLVYVQGGSPENLQAGIRILETALQLDPNYFDALFELGNMHHLVFDRPDLGDEGSFPAFTAAIRAYRRAMAVNPRAREPREEWARICLKMANDRERGGHLRNAHEILLQVAKDASDIPALYEARVRLNLHRDFATQTGQTIGDAFQGAYEALETLAKLSPGSPELPLLRAMYYRRLGGSYYITWVKVKGPEAKAAAKERAVEAFRKALEAAPEDPENARVRESLRQLAPEYIEIDRLEAQEAYEAAQEAFHERRYDDAVAGFRRAYLLFPEATRLRCMYGLALARALDLDAAKEHLSAVANAEDGASFPQAMFELGQISVAQKNEDAARVWFERYLAAQRAAGVASGPGVEAAEAHLRKLSGTRDD